MEDAPNRYKVVKKAHAGTRLPSLEDVARVLTCPADAAELCAFGTAETARWRRGEGSCCREHA